MKPGDIIIFNGMDFPDMGIIIKVIGNGVCVNILRSTRFRESNQLLIISETYIKGITKLSEDIELRT